MELGFVEEVEDPQELTSSYYPSKVGGKPAWLDQFILPSVDVLTCKKCGKSLVHLLQIQSSSCPAHEIDHHRTIFIFICADFRCHSPGNTASFMVLRCELHNAIENPNLMAEVSKSGSSVCSSDKPLDNGCSLSDNSSPHTRLAPSLCIVCGIAGPMKCGKCKKMHYCSRGHQVHDWKAGHKQLCAELMEGNDSLDYIPSVGVVLRELEIVTELEPSKYLEEKKERSEQERMNDYHKYLQENQEGRKEVASLEELEKAAATPQKKDKQFRAFKKCISLEPTQVLRYQRGGDPLFVATERIPRDEDIPDCSCGAKRTFELQVMPQLLYYLKLDQQRSSAENSHTASGGIDWGTLLVYTCSSHHCTLGPGYHQEFLWKQDIS